MVGPDGAQGCVPLPGWRPAGRRREPGSGGCVERGNLDRRCQGRRPSGRPRQQSTDAATRAERFVVAMKPVKAGRAKGPRYPATSLGQPVMGGARGVAKRLRSRSRWCGKPTCGSNLQVGSWSGRPDDRGVREESQEQLVSDLEPDVIGDVLPAASSPVAIPKRDGGREAGIPTLLIGSPRRSSRWSWSPGWSSLPSGLVRLPAEEVCGRCSGPGTRALLAIQLVLDLISGRSSTPSITTS